MDEDEDFFDTVSFASLSSRKRFSNNKDYISLSRNTIYHSAFDIDAMELMPVENSVGGGGGGDAQNKVARNREILTYTEWRNRRSRSFSNSPISVDYVLAYENDGRSTSKDPNVDSSHRSLAEEQRQKFQENLREDGLCLEEDNTQRIHFVKLHAPFHTLCRYAELLKLRFPIAKRHRSDIELKENCVSNLLSKCLDVCRISVDSGKFPVQSHQLTAEFSNNRKYLFDLGDDFFSTSDKITVVSYILERAKFGTRDQEKGIKQLITNGVYKAAYPLHEGDFHNDCQRKLLADEWASVSKCIKYQPIDDVKDYFGIKFALYFTWLGFYTHMLIPASVVGILCVVFAATTLNGDHLSNDICNLDITMCPRCDKYCDYWKLSESCTYSKIQHFIDNPGTLALVFFMSVWATVYLKLWKRYSAEIAHRWGLSGYDLLAEPPRPEYLIKLSNAKKQKINIVTQLEEPTVPFWQVKLPSIILSFTVAFVLVWLALCVVFGIVMYRMSLVTAKSLYSDQSSNNIYVMPITAALLNLVGILILNFIYDYLAIYLTDMELQRTQTEYDESLSLKIYMFQFVNFYSSIFYIAFLKGKFVGYPLKYNKVLGYRQEECNPGGCLMELTIQLMIIMIGKQFINAIVEMGIPILKKLYTSMRITAGLEKEEVVVSNANQWTEDYKLSQFDSTCLFSEYLEMVLQYGFVTIFVAAFPLAPLFALINNILEMRLDAKKFIKYYRRPVPQRVKDIGIWLPILGVLGRIAVVSNAFIIAFSSNFIPLLVYKLKVSSNHTEEGYLEFSLAYFNTSDFPMESRPESSAFSNVSICRYAEFRNPQSPDPTVNYKRPIIYWHILAARLAFVVAYQNLVTLVTQAVEWIIPDISRKLNDQIKREVYKTNELIIKNQLELENRNYPPPDGNGFIQSGTSSQRSSKYYDTYDS